MTALISERSSAISAVAAETGAREAHATAGRASISRAHLAWRIYGLALLMVDAVLLGFAFVGAARLRVGVLPLQEVPFDPLVYTFIAAALIPCVLVVFWLRHAYDRRYLLAGPDEYARIFSGCTYGTLLVVAASYLYGSSPVVSRVWLLLLWA